MVKLIDHIKANPSRLLIQIAIYLGYFVQGFTLIILAQTVSQLTGLWHASLASATTVVSAIGFGKLVAYPILGELADRVNRKRLLIVALLAYLTFFSLLPLTHTVWLAFGLTGLAGVANATLDSIAYPTLLAINHGKSNGNVFIKAMISLGEAILPVLLVVLLHRQLWFGWAFWTAAGVLIITLLIALTIDSRVLATLTIAPKKPAQTTTTKHWHWDLLNILFMVYGFTAMWLMIHFTQWVTRYFKTLEGFSVAHSQLLLSVYSIGSLTGVGTIFVITQRVWLQEATLLLITAVSALVGLSLVLVSHTMALAGMGSFIFGTAAAGGALQLGLSQFIAHNPEFAGRVTGWYFFCGGIAILVMPALTGAFAATHLALVMRSLVIVALINIVIVVINFRHQRQHGHESLAN
ncbi:MFS transporter [Periweissella ghanensis]|uniref:Inner membrane transport protein YdiM n=1 Tax=Periweissella ghanensis TaxID=467997 RepID=A0ABM8ZAQ7_9LACO|nr:MFS transporter [Periweissella ghanensis]MCM0601158.1 MFS transporter [Periweissella ghanensis]CAH0417954.1 Inner membrane transport protein YdiM [Periweissella ghanensis]